MLNTWKRIPSPPFPYVEAVRTTTNRGLHVIIAVRRNGERFEVYSISDHGTAVKTIHKEADAETAAEAVGVVRGLCESYEEAGGGTAEGTHRGQSWFIDISGHSAAVKAIASMAVWLIAP